jgi:outer membrane protein OmpA-like peptidoglycan-associated protein
MKKEHRSMRFLRFILCLFAFLPIAASAGEEQSSEASFGTPVSTTVSVSFPDGSSVFRPSLEQADRLGKVRDAAMIVINGRTSTLRYSPKDEALALARAASARSWLITRGASPLKIMINYASAADFVSDNSTAEGRYQNQRVDIEVIYVPTF